MISYVARAGQTVTDETDIRSKRSGAPIPGIVLIWSNGVPVLRGEALIASGLEVGRASFGGKAIDDDRISSQHARVAVAGDGWIVEDLGSRNGTFVNGERIEGRVEWRDPGILRLGRSFFLRTKDVRPFIGDTGSMALVERRGDVLLGPSLRAAWIEIERAARHGDVLLVSGESGVGKELAARAFHEASARPTGPFIGVNCAAIPEGLAERLLFGAKRGAYSGATADVEGYLGAADGGTLFLDEIADLGAEVQAKLLRAIEAKEVLALGASRPRSVNLRICSAAHDLRAEVAAGRFRSDLYFRIGRPEVTIPPLRERLEELPWLVASELERASSQLEVRASFLEACLLRPWPGNVRELSSEVRRVAALSLANGQTKLGDHLLAKNAGAAFEGERDRDSEAHAATPDRATIEAALRDHDGNVSGAARALGLHRNQLRRWLAKNGKTSLLPPGSEDPEQS
jgi:transcriptional regulator of acetoin/glycerol metabolism